MIALHECVIEKNAAISEKTDEEEEDNEWERERSFDAKISDVQMWERETLMFEGDK